MSVTGKSWAVVAFIFIAWLFGEVMWFRAREMSAIPVAKRLDAPAVTAPDRATGAASPGSIAIRSIPEVPGTATARTSDPTRPATTARPEATSAEVPRLAPPKVDPLGAPKAEPPKFDIVRVEPTGDTVVAGQGAPNATVDLLVSGKIVARATTDATGHFAMLPPALKPGSSALTLQQGEGAAAIVSAQSIAVSVPEKAKGAVVVALAEPGQPTKILAAPSEAAASRETQTTSGTSASAGARPPALTDSAGPKPSESDPKALAIRSVELENGTGFFASGHAASGTLVRVYLNDSPIATVVAGLDKSWSVKIIKGLASGHYTVRADALAGGTRVANRVEVPFDVPVAMASSAGSTQTVTAPSAVQTPSVASAAPGVTSDAVVEEVKTTIVNSGDNLWDISRAQLGEGRRYTRIYAANLRQIRDPKLIYPGQIFVVPSRDN